MITSTSKNGAQQVSRSGGFDLPSSADAVFSLFTPEGERGWIKGWNPRPVYPDEILFARDTVFREGSGDGEAVWTILDADWRIHRAEYVRVAPASHTAHIVVKVDSLDADRSHVTVSYTVTTFGESASALLESFVEAAFVEKMRNWQRLATEYLATSNSGPASL